MPVPKPVHFSTDSLKSAHEIAVAAEVLDIPISPNINKSQSFETELNPNCIASIISSCSIAFSFEKSLVGVSSFIGITDNFTLAKLHSWLIAAPPFLKLATICLVTSAG